MPRVTATAKKTTPKGLKPYVFHGVNLSWTEDDAQAAGDCPFCGKEGKFSVDVKGGLWKCWVCGEGTDKGGGNVFTFLRKLWDASDAATNGATKVLAADRKLLYPETLTYWGICQSVLDGCWLVPGYGIDGKLNQLYSYRSNGKGGKTLFPTPELHHQLHGVNLFDKKKGTVYICEGPWDAMALWELLRLAKRRNDDGGLTVTGAEASSLLADASVLAVPGCNSFSEAWLPLFAGKHVVLCYDSDHPRTVNGKAQEPAGWTGMRRVAGLMAAASESLETVSCIHWGKDGYDKSLKSGFDVRDALTAAPTLDKRLLILSDLLKIVKPVPEDWIKGRSKAAANRGETTLECLPCESWAELTNSWRKCMEWIEGLDRGLSVMLAAILSTKMLGDPLWIKLIGPPSCGKSTLCEALAIAKKYVYSVSTITGFHSGWKTDGAGDTDHGLVPKINGKTLITKDGDPLLSHPNKDKILSEARDLYDCTARVHYLNGVSREHDDVRMTWLLCGTESLRALDGSELGERFLDCVVLEDIDEELERDIGRRKIFQALRNVGIQADGTPESRQDDAMTTIKQLTGGYVCWLREHGVNLLAGLEADDATVDHLNDLGLFVAFMRARPSKRQEETEGRELSTRLASQVTRLAACLAVVLNRKRIDDEVMRRVTRVALDTARGRTLEIVKHLFAAGEQGMSLGALSILTGETDTKELSMLRFLKRKKLGVVEAFKKQLFAGLSGQTRWRLTPKMTRLYAAVTGQEVPDAITVPE